MAHLGDRVAALVDGQLSGEGVERAHAHLAGCRPCRDAVEAERLMKARLSALRGPEPGADLMQRLLAMGGPNGPMPPHTGYVPGTPRPQPVAMPRSGESAVLAAEAGDLAIAGDHAGAGDLAVAVAGAPAAGPLPDRPAGRRVERARPAPRGGSSGPGRAITRRRTRLAVAAVFGALSVVGVGISGLAAGNAARVPSAPTVLPPVDAFVVEHGRTTGNLPFVDVSNGWQLTSAGQDGGAGR